MTQKTLISDSYAFYVAPETSFGNSTTPIRADVAGKPKFAITPAEVENLDARGDLFDGLNPEVGLSAGTLEFEMYLRPPATQLSASTTPLTNQNMPLATVLKALMGGMTASVGSTVDGGSGNTIMVATGTGGHFPVGSVIGIETDNDGIEAAYVVSRSADTLTITPAVSGAPAVKVIGSYTFYPTQDNTGSLTAAVAMAGDTNSQFSFTGCNGEFDLKFALGELASISAKMQIASGSGPSALGLNANPYTSIMSSPLVVNHGVCVLQSTSDNTRTQYMIEECTYKIENGMSFLPGFGSTTIDGKAGVARTKGKYYATATVKFRSDTTIDPTLWAARPDLQFWMMASRGAGDSKRWVVVGMPVAVVVGKPVVDVSKEYLTYTVTLRSKLNTLCDVDTLTDLQKAPLVVGLL